MGQVVKNPKYVKCCNEIDVQPLMLFRPELLDERGREFMAAHGLLWTPDLDPDYELQRLAEMVRAGKPMPDGHVKIEHRCAKLTKAGKCSIYAKRPAICREFACGDECQHGA